MKKEIQLTIIQAKQVLNDGFVIVLLLPLKGGFTLVSRDMSRDIVLTKGIIELVTQENYNSLEAEGGLALIPPSDRVNIR